MLGVANATAAVIALVALLVTALQLVSAEAMIVLGIGYTPTPVIPTAAGFIEAVCFVPAQTMIVLGISYPATPVISAAARTHRDGLTRARSDDDRARDL